MKRRRRRRENRNLTCSLFRPFSPPSYSRHFLRGQHNRVDLKTRSISSNEIIQMEEINRKKNKNQEKVEDERTMTVRKIKKNRKDCILKLTMSGSSYLFIFKRCPSKIGTASHFTKISLACYFTHE